MLIDEIDRFRLAYRAVHVKHPFETIAICVLPDHLHAIWQLPDGDADFGDRWRMIKRQFSAGLPASPLRSESKTRKREKGIWQRRFWEHQIRDDRDLAAHVDYIHFNPVKHGLVARVRDWPHSSFHRFVKEGQLPADWGGAHVETAGKFWRTVSAWARCALPTLQELDRGRGFFWRGCSDVDNRPNFVVLCLTLANGLRDSWRQTATIFCANWNNEHGQLAS